MINDHTHTHIHTLKHNTHTHTLKHTHIHTLTHTYTHTHIVGRGIRYIEGQQNQKSLEKNGGPVRGQLVVYTQ